MKVFCERDNNKTYVRTSLEHDIDIGNDDDDLTDDPLRAPPHPDDVLGDRKVVGSADPLGRIQETDEDDDNVDNDDDRNPLFSGDIYRMGCGELCAPSVSLLYTLLLLPQPPDVDNDNGDDHIGDHVDDHVICMANIMSNFHLMETSLLDIGASEFLQT